ncbi:BSD domain-containing protein 1-A-like [Abrus precatorius]|uniref:BSD domain-containing protein 1-A-like n=1 Tax=Abrus precatorius TaxID=3816 RepID=A0A8B8MDH1_ABRPR|nr:BSD domain-containing protein 1-A-like [Abrus precatorius]XP_027365882.1 BSD domain-containing protein 1-A-like [Abrus precatorius]
MNFFKSVFLDDPDPLQPESESNNAAHNKDPDPESSSPTKPLSTTGDSGGGDGWNFGGLFKTLTEKSESIIETYRRDLQEFGTGLKKEIEVAHGSLGTVGHAIDEFGNTVVKGTAQIISQGKDAILAGDLDSDSDNGSSNRKRVSGKSSDSKRYSRFEAQVRAIQGDVSTYSEEPEDLSEFNEWKLGFSLDGKSEEMEGYFRENDAMESVYKRVVPNIVDHETFWSRYYYKVYRLKKAEDVRARLVRRISKEEELSWDVEDEDDDDDDDEEEEEYDGETKPELMINKEGGGENVVKRMDTQLHIGGNEGETKRLNEEKVQHYGEEGSKVEKSDNLLQTEEVGNKMDKSVEEKQVEKSEVVHEMGGGSKETAAESGVDKASKLQVDDALKKNDSAAECDEKVIREREAGDGKYLGKNNESLVAETQHSSNEEDLEWDDIEDLSSIDEKKATHSSSTSKVDLRKRLSAAEEEEDLSWDIEDDDEPAKA